MFHVLFSKTHPENHWNNHLCHTVLLPFLPFSCARKNHGVLPSFTFRKQKESTFHNLPQAGVGRTQCKLLLICGLSFCSDAAEVTFLSYVTEVLSLDIQKKTSWWFQTFSYFHPLGKIPILTHIFQMGWNHHLENPSIFCWRFLLGFLELKRGWWAGWVHDGTQNM